MKLLAIILLFTSTFILNASEYEFSVIYPRLDETDTRDLHKIELLESVLKLTEKEYGPYRLAPSENVMSEARMQLVMEKGNQEITVIFKPTTKEREEKLTPVRIPLLKGLLGYRIFLINEARQKDFTPVDSLKKLQKFIVGQGLGWQDIHVFEHNGIDVIRGNSYEGLFKMLMMGRFDFFSRGVTEAPFEYLERKNNLPGLHIEENILLYYPWPVYFFTQKTPTGKQLAERLEKGLRILIKNGEFEHIFTKYYRNAFKNLHLKSRHLITIENPLLPEKTPLDQKELWLDINQLDS